MPAITIMAEVDGTIAVTTVQVDKLDWIPLHGMVGMDHLPYRIVEVTICTDKGVFRQILPGLVEELEERTSWWKLWWK